MRSRDLEVDGRIVALDKHGFLLNAGDWSEALAKVLAAEEGLQLEDEHLQVLHALRNFYTEFQLSPAMRPLVRYLAQQLGPEIGNSLYLLKLFPGSPARVASRLAGLPKPDNCL
ncbi:MAG: TusE/DsrC/DsvC family sulfur relay protein [Halopseudomonas yangmingensis]|uniref:Sulfurtransferase n=1 Tax=Halopseudomonas yangmingensis TaxID=1720063 RepID=A0A1I4RR47_9GAMM|nr:TusE/DsrC/DsvC family sulfur relay protein [Halopseudomonas yangmingensis]SFM54634.1 tRNA 2-thiouridine synthesizing protein E [Halopseudomonas yangmingensis]